jgi:hypothetical protein
LIVCHGTSPAATNCSFSLFLHKGGDLEGLVEIEFAGLGAVLIEHRDPGVLEYSVAGGVTGAAFFLDFGSQVIGRVLRLPPAAGEAVFVADGAIGNDAASPGIGGQFGDQSPAALCWDLRCWRSFI